MVQAARCRRVVDPGDCPYLLFDRRSNPVERRAQLVVDTHAEPAQRAPDHAGTPSGVESTTWLSLEEAMHLEFRVSVLYAEAAVLGAVASCRHGGLPGFRAEPLNGRIAPTSVAHPIGPAPPERTLGREGLGTATGGNAAFPICPVGEVHPSKAVIDGLRPRHCAYFNSAAGRWTGRGIFSSTRGHRSSELRVTAWT